MRYAAPAIIAVRRKDGTPWRGVIVCDMATLVGGYHDREPQLAYLRRKPMNMTPRNPSSRSGDMPNLEICESEKTCLQHQHVGRTRHALTVFARYSLLSTATDGREGYALA